MPERHRRRRRRRPRAEQAVEPIPDWAEQEREGDLVWIRENLHVFWPAHEQAHEEHGRGTIVVDITQQPTGDGHPFGYFPQEFFEEQADDEPMREDILRMVGAYDPSWELVVLLLKGEGRSSTYRVGLPEFKPDE